MARSHAALKAHQAIMAYLRSGRGGSRAANAIFALDEHSILETSINGYSHLMDVFHLPFVMRGATDPISKSNYLFYWLRQQAISLGRGVYAELLTLPDKKGNTPLHHAAMSGSYYLVSLLLADLKATLSSSDYYQALNSKSHSQQRPYCPRKKPNAREINRLLIKESEMVRPLPVSSAHSSSFFSKKRSAPTPSPSQAPHRSSPQEAPKRPRLD